jgi:RsiW-degrading membrane proteinase PrsW (M82 family)
MTVAAMAWLLYFRWRAERAEPRPLRRRLVAVIGGCVSAFLGWLLFRQLELLGVSTDWERMSHAAGPEAFRTSMLIGAIEELCKLLPVLLFVRLGRGWERPLDGLLLAACAGIGFSGAEGTVLWLHGDLSWSDLLARAAAAPFTHALFSMPWGLGLTAALSWGRSSRLLLGLGVSILSHGLYDWVLASPAIPQIAAALAVLVLWLSMLRWLQNHAWIPVPVPVRVRT